MVDILFPITHYHPSGSLFTLFPTHSHPSDGSLVTIMRAYVRKRQHKDKKKKTNKINNRSSLLLGMFKIPAKFVEFSKKCRNFGNFEMTKLSRKFPLK